jgi:hypothetical protein
MLCVSHICTVSAVRPSSSRNANSRLGVTSYLPTEPTVWAGGALVGCTVLISTGHAKQPMMSTAAAVSGHIL